jgi:1-acyl-sn-glycerol-3-phosphate acyltransferase
MTLTAVARLEARLARRDEYPLLMIAPEGVTTNGDAVVKFQTGAFAPGVTVLPVLIRYPRRAGEFNPAWTVGNTGAVRRDLSPLFPHRSPYDRVRDVNADP